MSFRVGLDVPRETYMDAMLVDAGSMEALADKAGWEVPQKVFYQDWKVLLAYVRQLRVRQYMPTRHIWQVFRLMEDGQHYRRIYRRGEKPGQSGYRRPLRHG